ncbi:sensor histidine kinase [Persicobacter diffluens]
MKLLSKIYRPSIWEFAYWFFALIFIAIFLGHFHHEYQNTFLFSLMLMPVMVSFSYFLANFLIRELWQKGLRRKFWLYLFYGLVTATWFQLMAIMVFFISLAELQYKNMNPMMDDLSLLWVIQIMIATVFTVIIQLKRENQQQKAIQRLESDAFEMKMRLKELELNALKEQIHPHFLFNTLNNLYGLALEKSEKLPEALLRLSQLLDFLVYQSQKEYIPLGTELQLIQDYIALETLRFEERLESRIEISTEESQFRISPFLLFPLVENAFKHGLKPASGSTFLSVKAWMEKDSFQFEVINSLPAKPLKTKNGGLGLINLKQRLELHYPKNYQLSYRKTAEQFEVSLSIKIKENEQQPV